MQYVSLPSTTSPSDYITLHVELKFGIRYLSLLLSDGRLFCELNSAVSMLLAKNGIDAGKKKKKKEIHKFATASSYRRKYFFHTSMTQKPSQLCYNRISRQSAAIGTFSRPSYNDRTALHQPTDYHLLIEVYLSRYNQTP